MTRSDVGQGPSRVLPGHGRAASRARRPARYYINQFGNPANPRAHESTHRPGDLASRWTDDVDAIVCGVGSGGTMTGLSRYFARVAPHDEMVLADPSGSVLAEYVNARARSDDGGLVAGRRHRRGLPAADLRPLAREEGLRDHRRGELR